MRHCIITCELAPFVRNGGVGTNALHLAELLSADYGGNVHVLMTEDVPELLKQDRTLWERVGHLELTFLQDVDPPWVTTKVHSRRLAASLRVLWWLRGQRFDVIHFMQYTAPGFAAIRAKRLGVDFQNTQLVTIMNSPERWLAEHGRRQPDGSASGLVHDFMERYCVAHADHVTCPTQALMDWMRRDGWTLPANLWHLPTYSPPVPSFKRRAPDPHHLVFFGRLETRKGLELFVAALRILAESGEHAGLPLRISFLGKVGAAGGGGSSETYLKKWLADLPPVWHWEILGDLDQMQAMAYLEEHSGALFLMPSLADNSPNTVLECLARELRVLCADAPGVAELFADKHALVPLNPGAWAARLAHVIGEGSLPARPAETLAEAKARRAAFMATLAAGLKSGLRIGPSPDGRQPLISVIVPHFNSGVWLHEALQTLALQDYPSFEVLVIDDGSTCPRSQAIFTALERGNRDPRVRYFRQTNGGVCAARNHGAARAVGEVLMFFDSDNLAQSDMLTRLHACMEYAGLDVVTCDLYAFEDGVPAPFSSRSLHWGFAGGPLEGALKVNCLGDSNMLVRRSCFEAVGGFRSEPNEASADRALLVRLLKAGFKLDCVGDPLFAYRRHAGSMSATAETFDRARAVMNAFTEGMEPWMRRTFESNFRIYGSARTEASDAPQEVRGIRMRQRLIQEREKRRERDRRVDLLFETLNTWRKNPFVRFAKFIGTIRVKY